MRFQSGWTRFGGRMYWGGLGVAQRESGDEL
jgi:hypothetical protein